MSLPPPPPPTATPSSPAARAGGARPAARSATGCGCSPSSSSACWWSVRWRSALRAANDGPSHPSRWDPRVADLVSFVEQARGLHFDHPVQVDFLDPAAYTKASTTDVGTLGAGDKAQLARDVGQLRALGVVSGKLDLAAALNQETDSGTLAFYSPKDKRVRVRGTTMSVGLRVTLVHELTHALQDQHFNLSRLIDDHALDDSESTAHRGLAEGDALRIEDDYVAQKLTKAEKAVLRRRVPRRGRLQPEGHRRRAALPRGHLRHAVRARGPVRHDALQRRRERHGRQGLPRPARHRGGPLRPGHLPPAREGPAHRPRPARQDRGGRTFSSPSWFLVLAERIDPSVAFNAALGWAGDHYALFQRDGATCVRAVFRGATARDETEMRAALDQWISVLPGGKAKRIDVKGHPGFEACDPGAGVDMKVTGRSSDVLVLPNVWGYLVAEAAPQLGPAGSRCFAGQIIQGLTYQQLNDPAQQDALTKVVAERAVSAYAACGSKSA